MVEVVHCPVGLVHAHVRLIPQECRVLGPQRFLYAPSAIISFTSLDICISPVEYDVSLHKVNTM
jgi:hypothetical protein